MSTFVLVPGFWLGGWSWSAVAQVLNSKGHRVYTPTLTGLAERVHLGSATTDLDTHIRDIANVLRFEELQRVILVGHSYAGIVTTAVADHAPERIRKLIYVDTGPLPDGVASADFVAPKVRASYEKLVAEQGDGWRLPLPSWESLDANAIGDLDSDMRTRMRERATPMPYNAAKQPVVLSNPARLEIPHVAIWCTFTSVQVRKMAGTGNRLFTELARPNWTFLDLPGGHWPMFSQPQELAEVLHSQS